MLQALPGSLGEGFMMKNMLGLRRAAVSCFALSVALVSAPAWAQTAEVPSEQDAPESPEADDSIDTGDIVVTALRREQRLQDVPAAISVLDASTIKAKGGQDFRDYLTSVPGVNFAEGPLGGMRVTIRGVSDGVGGSDPLAGIYIDEAPITESFFGTLDPDVYDLDRVEILRGPQGTLYGASSMGGTVRVITKKPKLNDVEGAVEGTVSDVAHGGWNYRVDGFVNVPIVSDLIAFRASAGYRKDDGWIDNIRLGEENANTVEKKNARAQILLQPSPDTSIILGGLYQEEDLGTLAYDDVALPDYQTSRLYRPFTDSDAKLVSLTVRHDFEAMSLISATNYLNKNIETASDSSAGLRGAINAVLGITLGANEPVGSVSTNDFSLFSQEVRLASSGQNRLDYVIGGFYSNANTKVYQTFDLQQAPTARAKTTNEGFFVYDQEYRTEQMAGFGELTFHASEKIALTAGFRVFNVEQRTVTLNSGTFNGGSSTQVGVSNTTAVQQKYLAEFQPTDNHLIYLQAAQGYRNGAPTGNGLRPNCAAELAALGYATAPTEYGPDKLWNFEIGSKNTLLDGRMTLNAAAFYIDWTDIQSSISLTCGSGFVANAGKAVSKGVELESTIEPVEGLNLAGGITFTDAEITEKAPGIRGVSDGDPLPHVSRWSWNASAQYRHDLGGGLNGFVRGEVNHVGSRWNAFRSTATSVLMEPYTLVNVRLGVGNDRWSAAIFATNLLDKRYVTLRTTGGSPFELVGRPRTIGVNARIGF